MINPYQGPSLQDILGQDYSSGYAPQPQLGIGDIPQAVPPTAYSTMTAQNPGLADQIQAAIARQLNIANDPRSQQPPDMAYGRESSFGRTNQGVPDDETSALDVAQSIIKLPFGLLSEGRNLIQDTLGLPGAQARRRDADQVQALQNLPQAQRQLLGIDQISGISTPGASVGDSSGTAGAPSSLGQNAGSTMKGFVQWTQNLGRDRAQQTMDQVRMAIKAQYAAGKIGLQEAQRLTELATGNANVEQSRLLRAKTTGENIHNYFMPAQEQADLRVKGTAATANLAQAGASNANARNADARTQTENELRGPAVDKANAEAKGEWTKNYYYGEGGELDLASKRQALDQSAKRFPYTIAGDVAGINKDITAADKDRGVFGNTGGVASGTQGAHGTKAIDPLDVAKQEFEARNTVSEALQGKNGTPAISKKEASERYGIPLNDGWFGDSLDWGRYDPTNTRGFSGIDAGTSSTAPPSGRTALGQPTPLLPLPPLDSGSAVPGVKPQVRGEDINRVFNTFQGSALGGYSQSDKMLYAKAIAELLPTLRDADEDTFAAAADQAQIPMDLAEAFWNASKNR